MQRHKALRFKVFLPVVALLLGACGGGGGNVQNPDFTLSLNPQSLTVTQGGTGTTQLTITPQGGFTGTVNLSLVNQDGNAAPSGITLSPTSVSVSSSGPVNQTLTINVASSVQTGTYNLKLKATSGNITKETGLTLTVQAQSPQVTTFTVNTTADTIDTNPGDGQCTDEVGKCSLRAAVMEANALSAPQANALSATVVIEIPAGTYTLTPPSSVDEEGGDLDIKSDVTLKGAGAGQTILDGDWYDRVLQIYAGATVKVEGVTIQYGEADNYGGGILNVGTLTLTNSTVRENDAYTNGGGIYNVGTLTLENSTVSGNWAYTDGGGIYNDGGDLTLTNSTVSGNWAYTDGGGIYVSGSSSSAKLSFSTIAFNDASGQGGGIYIASGTDQDQIQIKGVILGDNSAGSNPDCSGSLTSKGYNLIENNTSCITAQTGDITGDPLLNSSLDYNGGPTKNHMPLYDPLNPSNTSPALNKVPQSDCTTVDGTLLTTDQRGKSRPQASFCDIGAVERQDTIPPASAL